MSTKDNTDDRGGCEVMCSLELEMAVAVFNVSTVTHNNITIGPVSASHPVSGGEIDNHGTKLISRVSVQDLLKHNNSYKLDHLIGILPFI